MKYIAAQILMPVLLLVGGAAGFIVLGQQTKLPVPPPENLPTLVETAPIQQHDKGFEIEASGLVVPFREVRLSVEVAGRVIEKSPQFDAGRRVKQGELLLKIDPRNYQLELDRLQREAAQAQAELDELEVELANTESLITLAAEHLQLQQKDLQRMTQLAQRNSISEAELEASRRTELTSRDSLTRLENQKQTLSKRRPRLEEALKLIAVRRERAQLDLDRTIIKSPVAGIVVRDVVELDSFVQLGAEIAVIEDTSQVDVQCNLKMTDLDWIWSGFPSSATSTADTSPRDAYALPPAAVKVVYQAAGKRYIWQGHLSRYDGLGVDELTRTVPCRVQVDNPQQMQSFDDSPQAFSARPMALIRGMYVTVLIDCRPEHPVLRIPESAMRPGNVVWLVREGKLRQVTVQPLRVLKDSLLISPSQEIQTDDVTIVSPLGIAHNEMPVRIKK